MPRVARSTQGTTKKTPYATRNTTTSHCDVDTPNNDNAQRCSSNMGAGKCNHSYGWYSSLIVYRSSDTRIKNRLTPVAENEGADGCQGKPRQGMRFCCGDRNRLANNRQAPKARRLKAQEPATVPTPTRSLPNRPGRNIHPAGVPRVRRSKEQIEAEREVTKKALEVKTRKAHMAKERLAQMNLREEHEDNLPLQHPPRLPAMTQKRRHMDMETDSDESFDLREADDHGSDLDVDSVSDVDSDSGPKPLKAVKPNAKVCLIPYLG